jgi:hypothetical protein
MDHAPTKKKRQPKLSVSMTPELLDQLDQVVAHQGHFATRHAVHLAALKLGLAQLEADPTAINQVLDR